MKTRSLLVISLCLLIACGILVSPSAAARKVPKRPIIVKPKPVIVPPPVIVRPVPPPIQVVTPKPIPPKPVVMQNNPQYGVSVGYIAGIPGAIGEVRFHDPFEFKSTSLRLGAGYAQGADSTGATRKHALVILDGIYRMTAPDAAGLRSYFGLGVNFDAYTTGRTSGSVGGEVFYGVEANAGSGQMYGEIGYGLINPISTPNLQGLSLQVGFKI